jgi:hypothetical protein
VTTILLVLEFYFTHVNTKREFNVKCESKAKEVLVRIHPVQIHLPVNATYRLYVCAYHLGVDVFLEAASKRTNQPFALIEEALADKDLSLRVLGGAEHGVVLVLQHHTLTHHRQQRVAVAVTQGEGC